MKKKKTNSLDELLIEIAKEGIDYREYQRRQWLKEEAEKKKILEKAKQKQILENIKKEFE